ncbi:potassium channel family protein [Subtercola boreus]|uniref:Potassium transporter n=1 Tax=Subtercola boreus TaxID=120213 RepID=A0A3E0WGI8_9MICO|nr:TrkA family potassium uptake protein [Subtercola boreus]RFA23630.1 potassium transporter [Subtercola boreus]RFA24024.1 potassium transporter [Subtercola boreus]RFA29723.1 potassium transporter [Subtercola boreus]
MAKDRSTGAPVLVIGLGRFGAAAADKLEQLGREVLVIDTDATLVQKWATRVTHVVQADATDLDALRQIGGQDFDTAIMAVGSSVEGSVLITANLVDLGVTQIWAKAMSRSHGKILERIGANHVLYPEAESGDRIAHLVSGQVLDFIEFDDELSLAKLRPPVVARDAPLAGLTLRSRFGITIVGVKSHGAPFVYAGSDTVVGEGDFIVVSGTAPDIDAFARLPR